MNPCTFRYVELVSFLVVWPVYATMWPTLGRRFQPRGICNDEDKSPCYDVVLVYLVDGPFPTIPPNDEDVFLNAFGVLGFSRQDVIDTGRAAAQSLLDKYGVDFTGLPEESYLYGQTVGAGAFFRTVDFVGNYRLVSGTRRGEVFPYNNQIKDVAWQITFTSDFISTGTYTGTIPAGAFVGVGSYIIDLCGHSTRFCTPFTTLGLHTRFLHIVYRPRSYIRVTQDPGPLFRADCDTEHEVWGNGVAQGVFHILGGTTTQGHNVIRFPSLLPDP